MLNEGVSTNPGCRQFAAHEQGRDFFIGAPLYKFDFSACGRCEIALQPCKEIKIITSEDRCQAKLQRSIGSDWDGCSRQRNRAEASNKRPSSDPSY